MSFLLPLSCSMAALCRPKTFFGQVLYYVSAPGAQPGNLPYIPAQVTVKLTWVDISDRLVRCEQMEERLTNSSEWGSEMCHRI